MMLSLTGYAFQWQPVQPLAATKCTGIHGMIKTGGLGQTHAAKRLCDSSGNNPMTTYRYRMHQEDLAKQFGRWYRMSHGNKKDHLPSGYEGRRIPFSVTAAFSISVTVIRANAGSAASLRTCGVPRLYMTGHRLIYGMPTIYLDMIITICMIFTTRPDLGFTDACGIPI